MKIKSALIFSIVFVVINVFGAEYVVKVNDTVLGKIVVTQEKGIWKSFSEIYYGVTYIVDTRTTYKNDGTLLSYEAVFKTDDEIVAKILGTNRNGKIVMTLYAYSDPKNTMVKTFTFNNSNLLVLDNNFVIPHFEMMLKFPRPSFDILIPQALFDPSKTEKATGQGTFKRLRQGLFQFSYEGVTIDIESDDHGITKMTYSNGIIVIRTKK